MRSKNRAPASYVQRRLWFIDRLEDDNSHYNIFHAWKLFGKFDSDAFALAIQTIAHRHETLRTSFIESEGEPIAIVHESMHVEALFDDLSNLPQSEMQEQLLGLLRLESTRTFDLTRAPLMRFRIVKLGPEEHVVTRTIHHIVFDAWSESIFARELKTLYESYHEGCKNPLEPLASQYSDFAARQRKLLEENGTLEVGLGYWTKQLAGLPDYLDLATDHPRTELQTFGSETCEVSLGKELVGSLKELSRSCRSTLYMTFLSALGIVLSRHSGQCDIAIGTPVANRQDTSLEGLIGCFVNTLVMRLRVDPRMTLRDLIAQVRSTTLSAYEHQDVPFERIVEQISPLRLLNRTPVFQVLFAFQNSPRFPFELKGLVIEPLDRDGHVARFDLEFYAVERGEEIRIIAVYNRDLFEHDRIKQMLGNYVRLLEVAKPMSDRVISLLPQVTDSQREQALYGWNRTTEEYPNDLCVHELIEQQAAGTPDRVAVVFEETSLSYGELNRRANQLAHALRNRGVGPESRVGICMERSLEMIVALLATMKTGGAYVPLDPEYPIERLRYMLDDSAPTVVLTEEHLHERLLRGGVIAPLMDITEAFSDSDSKADSNLAAASVGLLPEHPMYVIYTSGSTGVPKGVTIPHVSVGNFLHSMGRSPGIEADDILLGVTTFSFDIAALEFFLPLTRGAQLWLMPRDAVRDAEHLLRKLEQGVTMMQATPANWEALLEAGWQGGRGLRVLCGGEALSTDLARKLMQRGGTVSNLYGPTETTIWSLTEELQEVGDRVPIGHPIANTQVYVIDPAWGEAVPVGVGGELYIGGTGVARGYLNRADLTAERFVPDPYGKPGARLYRTGDYVRRQTDGELEYLGRNDFQVKVRGFRIELGEIELRLREHSGVRDAVVIAREDTPGDKRLVAYYTSRGEVGELGAEQLRSHLSERLPEHMVPSAFVHLEQMPLTPNGKLDRKALPAPDTDAYALRRYEEPIGEIECKLAAVWAEVLKIDQVGRLDNFFELGGHSLLGVRLISRLRMHLGLEVTIRDLFMHPVLAELARAVRNAGQAEQPPIGVAQRDGPLPLSFAQERLWFLAQMEGASEAYHIPWGVRLLGDLDVAALRDALNRIVERHEVLRTVFVGLEGEPVQQIRTIEESRFVFREHDLRDHVDATAELQRIVAEEALESFDLQQGPLLRGRLIRVAKREHALLLTMHHIVSDAWSMGVLMKELSALYEAFLHGEPDPLPEVKLQYADYTVWQRKWMEGELLQRQAEYWKKQLAGAPALLELPVDHRRPAQPDYAGATVGIVLDEDLTGELKELSRRHDTTLYMTLLAAWTTLLGRLSGQDEVVIGSPVANRGRVEIEGLIGFFVNTLALRVGLGGSPTVEELLQRVREVVLAGQQHQDIPFEQVVEIVRPVRSLSHHPLLQVMFAWGNRRETKLRLASLELTPLDMGPHLTTKFDLTLSLQDAGSRISGHLEFASALFQRKTAERYVEYLRMLLRGMVASERQPIVELPLLSQQEREQVLYGWNRTTEEFSSDRCVHELFEQQAAETPDRVAVVFGETLLSYGELNRRANRLAHTLRNRGVGPECRVGVCMERSLEMIVALLAIMKAGAAYVPLDPEYPVDRLRYMLEDSAPTVVLTEEHLHERLLSAGVMAPLVDITEAFSDSEAESNLDRASVSVLPEHLAYVIYTSGSTGSPKGVMVSHGNVARLLAATHPWFGFNGDDVWTFFHSYAFDFSVWEIWGCLSYAGRLVVVPRETTRSPEDFYQLLCSHQVTVLNQTPSAFGQLVAAQAQNRAQHPLRYVIFGGEALDIASLGPWYERVENQRTQLVNMYGITETTVHVTYRPLRRDEGDRRSPIGSPIPDLRTYVLETSSGEPAPVGVSGELYVGGAGVARGYLNRAGLTAERFVPDPYGEPGSRLYRTGDLGRWLPEGELEYMGRNDFQVKVRGFRIELGEIESRLREHGGVRDAVVIAREDTPGDTRLVAYYTSRASDEEHEVGAEALRRHISETLPEYMVPAAFVHLEQMPLTPNGKLERKALPAPDTDAYVMRRYEEPIGEIECKLAAVWAGVLKIDQVGRLDNFFELGGHSLLAVRLISRLRMHLGLEATIRDLFMHPVLADLARALQSARQAGQPPIGVAGRDKPLPLSFAQRRLWFLAQMEGVSEAYHIFWGVRLLGDLDVAALRDALNRIVERHEVLRTVFVNPDGDPVQQIQNVEESRFLLCENDLREHADATAELQRIVSEEAHEPFDLQRGPLIRGRLVCMGEREHALLLTMHHIVSDGWSMGVLMNELSTLYEAFLQGKPDPLPELSLQYADYAVWQRKWMEGEVLQQQAEYWKKQLAGAPALLELPADHRHPVQPDYTGATLDIALDEYLSRDLRQLSRRHGTTLYMTLLAAWAALLGRLSGQDEVVIGSPVANRGRVEVEGLIGFFVNTLALRVELSGSPTIEELLRRVHETVVAGQQHQDIPFEQVVEIVRPIRSLSHHPLFQVMFAWQNAGDGGRMRLRGLELKGLALSAGPAAKFDLMLSLSEAGGKISGSLQYATALFERATVERYVEYLRMLLRGMVAGELQPVSQLPLLSQPQREQVLYEWNRTEEEYPDDLCVHELFEQQAAETPDRVAVVFEESSLSYGELNRKANQLAHTLRDRGVGPETRVGICMERSLEMIVALLATMKAGAAYVPLDPKYPAGRLRQIVDDSTPSTLLINSALTISTEISVIDLREGSNWINGQSSNISPRSIGLTSEHLAYLIYTSGSTGLPKGVAVPHRGLCNLFTWMKRHFSLTPHDALLHFAPFTFDASVRDFFWPLITGARLVIAEPGRHMEPDYLVTTIQKSNITTMKAVPSMLQALLEETGITKCPSLARVICAGESLSQGLVVQFQKQLPAVTLQNQYGPTETTINATVWNVPEEAPPNAVPIGTPIANTQIYILDQEREPVPIGVTGELYIGGAGVTRAYWNHPKLTAAGFVPDRYSGANGARLYRTGDLARYRNDGAIEFIGRNDTQVKIRGFRIELGEIEARLASYEHVREVAVVVREDPLGDKRLVAYFTHRDRKSVAMLDASGEINELRKFVAAMLPDYMVPSGYVRLEKLPLNSNGKIDRKAFPEPDEHALAIGRYEAPVGDTEEALADIWANALKVERVGRHDNFFQLGGHSLLAVKVIAQMRHAGFHTDVRRLFMTPTVAEMSTSLDAESRAVEVPANRIPKIRKQSLSSAREVELRI